MGSMTGHNIGVVLVRLFSVYLAVTALQSLFFYLPAHFRPMMSFSDSILTFEFWLSVVAVLIPAICAYWMWRNAKLFVPEQSDADEFSITPTQLMFIGVSLLGLYFLVWGVVTLARVEASLAASEQIDSAIKMAQRAPYFVQILVAIPMLLGRKRLAELLLKIKYAGTGRS
jgi:hypothetical protein